jgi:hypothetical protein
MSCPSADLCVADGSGESGHVIYSTMYSTDPSVGSSWKFLPPAFPGATYAPDSPITCPSTNLCLAADDLISQSRSQVGSRVFAIRNPGLPNARWRLVGGGYVFTGHSPQTPWSSLSCPTAGFCAELVDNPPFSTGRLGRGVFWVSSHPAVPGSWHQRPVPYPTGGTVVCASEDLCLASTDLHRHETRVSFIRNPLSSGSRWHAYTLPLPPSVQYVGSISCVPSGGCIMIGGAEPMSFASAGILMSSDITGGPSTWTMSPEGGGDTFDLVGCLHDGTCYATTNYALAHPYQPGLVISADPFSKRRSAWQSTAANFSGSGADPSLTTCATPLVCFDAVVATRTRNTFGQIIETLRISY